MDRGSFLSSLPFILPTASQSWPPRTVVSETATAGSTTTPLHRRCRNEVLLKEHHVSIEACDPNSAGSDTNRTLGPCFFGSSSIQPTNETFDPSLCSFEMALEFVERSSPSASSGDNAYSRSYSALSPALFRSSDSPEHQKNKKPKAVEEEAGVFVRLDGRSFQVDVTALRQIELVGATTPEEEASGVPKPSCLLLKFPSCVFRVFSLYADDASDQHYLLQSVQSRVLAFLSAANDALSRGRGGSGPRGGFFLSAEVASPAGSSSQPSISSSEKGQKELTAEEEAAARERKQAQQVQAAAVTPAERARNRIKRRRLAHEQCKASLDSLRTVLDMPARTMMPDDGGGGDDDVVAEESPLDRIAPLLTACAEDLSNSYCRQADVKTVMTLHEQEIAACTRSLDESLDGFFPVMQRHRQRNRHHRRGVARAGGMTTTKKAPPPSSVAAPTPTPPPNLADTVETFQKLIEKQKQAVRERHKLLLLPTKG